MNRLFLAAHHGYRGMLASPIRSFILLAGFFGSLIIVTTLPFTGSDEEAHFVRAYGISEGVFRLYDTRDVDVPISYRKTIGCFQLKSVDPGAVYLYNYEDYGDHKKWSFACAFGLPLHQDLTEQVHTTAPAYSPTTYIPQVVVILVGKLFDMPVITMAYMVRFAVLATFIVMITLAIHLLPVRKWALVGISLLPLSLTHVTNPGGDYMLYGLAAIMTAVVVRSVYISKRDLKRENRRLLLILTVASILIVLPKGIFPGVCFLPLVVFYGGLRYGILKKICLVVGAAVVGLLWQKLGSVIAMGHANETTNSILDLPYAFIKTMFYRWVDTDFIYRGDFVGNIPIPGNHLGMPSIVVSIMNVLLAVYLFVGYPEKARLTVSKLQATLLKYTGLLITVGVVVGSFAALFIGASFMQDESLAIRGVHPRHFYAVLFMLCLLPFARSIRTATVDSFARIVIFGTILILTTRLLMLLIQFQWGVF